MQNPLEVLILDFYAMAGLSREFIRPDDAGFLSVEADADVAFNIVKGTDVSHIREGVIGSIKELFIRDVHFSLCCEIRHMFKFAKVKNSLEHLFKQRFGSIGREWLQVFKDMYQDPKINLHEVRRLAIDPAFRQCRPSYIESYFAVRTAEENTGLPLHTVCMVLFDPNLVQWGEYIGGRKWLEITKAYVSLLEASDTWEIIAAVDVLVAIEHNTATVFNKLAHWQQYNSCEWLAKVLDVKFQAKTPSSFVAMCSPDVQRVYNRLRRLNRVLSERPRYREDFKGGKRVEKFLEKKEVELRAFIRSLKKKDTIIVRHAMADRIFRVDSVYRGESRNGSFSTYVLKSCGWKSSRGHDRAMSYFPFSEDELVRDFVKVMDASEIEKANMVFAEWLRKVYAQFEGIIKRSSSKLTLGACLIDEDGGEARFRIYSAAGNIRFYFSLTDFKVVRIFFDTSEEAIQMPEQSHKVPEISTVDVGDTENIAITLLLFVNKVLEEVDDFLDKKMLSTIIKYVHRKAQK